MVVWRRRSLVTGFVLCALVPGAPALAGPRDLILVDHATGLAISGFDPVAYFLFHRAREGSGAYEARWGGAVWRFLNEGNRAAFLAQPDIYAPRFGGHDPVSAARGFVAEGDPLIFMIADNRLYLFHSLDTMAVFQESHAAIASAAERNWPKLVTNLGR